MEGERTDMRGAALSKAGAFVCTGLFAANISLLLPLLSLLLAGEGRSAGAIGLLGVCAAVGGMLAPVAVTTMVRGIGITGIALASLAIASATALLFRVSAGSLPAWYAIYALNSVGIAAVFILSEAMIISSASAPRRGIALGAYSSVYSLGSMLGAGILVATGTAGWAPFLVAAALPLAGAAVFLWVRSAGVGESLASPAGAGGARMRDVMPLMGLSVACAFAHGAMEVSVLNLLPVYASEHGYGDRAAASLLVAFEAGGFVLAPLIGWYARTNERIVRVMFVSLPLLVLVAPALRLSLAHDGLLLYPLMALWGSAMAALYLVGLVSVALRFSGLRLVAAGALFTQAYSLGMLAGPAAGGLLMQSVLPPHGLLLAFSALAAAPLAAFALSPRFRA